MNFLRLRSFLFPVKTIVESSGRKIGKIDCNFVFAGFFIDSDCPLIRLRNVTKMFMRKNMYIYFVRKFWVRICRLNSICLNRE